MLRWLPLKALHVVHFFITRIKDLMVSLVLVDRNFQAQVIRYQNYSSWNPF